MGILAKYGLGTRSVYLLWRYWDRFPMVARSGGYYRAPFKGQCGVNQGVLLSSTIFNLVVDAVLRNWVAVVAATEETAYPIIECFGQYIQWM